jgi:hypothetical protein
MKPARAIRIGVLGPMAYWGFVSSINGAVAPFLAESFSLSDAAIARALGWIGFACLAALALGRSADRMGRRRSVLLCCGAIPVAAAASALAPGLRSYVAAQLLVYGFGMTLLSALVVSASEHTDEGGRAPCSSRSASPPPPCWSRRSRRRPGSPSRWRPSTTRPPRRWRGRRSGWDRLADGEAGAGCGYIARSRRDEGETAMRRAILWLAVCALGCVQVQVTTHAEPGTDFSRLTSYAQAAAPHAPVVGERVRAEIAQVMQEKGYQEAPLDEADMVVAFHSSGESRARSELAPDPDTNYYVVRNYIEGTLTIDVFERGGHEPVWRGVGKMDIKNEREAPRVAAEAVRAILDRFPPG